MRFKQVAKGIMGVMLAVAVAIQNKRMQQKKN